MKLKIVTLTLGLIFFGAVSAQEVAPFLRQASLTAGYGYANGVVSSKSGSSLFIQMSYRLSRQFSLATEFEHLIYKAPGYYENLPVHPNVQNIFDDYFSLLIKYHLPFNAKLRASLATGWTFYTRQNEYYDFYSDGTTQRTSYRVSSLSNFGIPFLAEINYPLWKKLALGTRVKYNLNPKQGSTYSAGIGGTLTL